MKEIKLFPGKHCCEKEFDMKIIDAKDSNNESAAWIV